MKIQTHVKQTKRNKRNLLVMLSLGIILFSFGIIVPGSASEPIPEDLNNGDDLEPGFEIYDQYIQFGFEVVQDPEYVISIDIISPASIDAFNISVRYYLMNGSEFSQCLGQWGSINSVPEYYGKSNFTIDTRFLSFLGEVSLYEFYSGVDLMSGEKLTIPIALIQDIYLSFVITETDEKNNDDEVEHPSFFDKFGIYLIIITAVVGGLPLFFMLMQKGKLNHPNNSILGQTSRNTPMPGINRSAQLERRIQKRKSTKK